MVKLLQRVAIGVSAYCYEPLVHKSEGIVRSIHIVASWPGTNEILFYLVSTVGICIYPLHHKAPWPPVDPKPPEPRSVSSRSYTHDNEREFQKILDNEETDGSAHVYFEHGWRLDFLNDKLRNAVPFRDCARCDAT